MGDPAAFRRRQAANHHHGEDHGGGGAHAVVGMPLQLAGCVQHVGQVGDDVALRQAGAEQQGARRHAHVHEQGLGASDRRRVGPVGQHARLRHVVFQRGGHVRRQAGTGAPALEVAVQLPARDLPVQQVDRGHIRAAGAAGAEDAYDGGVGQRVAAQCGVVGHAGFEVAESHVASCSGSIAGTPAWVWAKAAGRTRTPRQRSSPSVAANSGKPIANSAIVRVSTGAPSSAR